MTTIRGLEPLLAARMEGRLLAREVLLWCDREPSKWAIFADAMGIPEGRATVKDDFRVLLRLDVILVANRLTAEVAETMKKIKEFARSIVFVGLEFDVVMTWDRERGEVEL